MIPSIVMHTNYTCISHPVVLPKELLNKLINICYLSLIRLKVIQTAWASKYLFFIDKLLWQHYRMASLLARLSFDAVCGNRILSPWLCALDVTYSKSKFHLRKFASNIFIIPYVWMYCRCWNCNNVITVSLKPSTADPWLSGPEPQLSRIENTVLLEYLEYKCTLKIHKFKNGSRDW